MQPPQRGSTPKREKIELKAGIDHQQCPCCGIARVRPINFESSRLLFNCANPKCNWIGYAELPKITKKLIYLDTSTIINITRAISKGEKQSPWLYLYDILKNAVNKQVICCPMSPVVVSEAELGQTIHEVIKVARAFGYTRLNSEGGVHQKQIWRAFDCWKSGKKPILETSPPPEDAFDETPHRWLPIFEIYLQHSSITELVKSHREKKPLLAKAYQDYAERYAQQGLSFDDIQKIESMGMGEGYIKEFLRSLEFISNPISCVTSLETASLLLPGPFALLIHKLNRDGVDDETAFQTAKEFFLSKLLSMIPYIDIFSRLYAALAMHCRGKYPRQPRESDSDDINHLATYLPYVDIFIADSFFANLCNQSNMNLGGIYGTKILSLTPTTVTNFISEIETMISETNHAKLSVCIQNSINDGGYHEERVKVLRAYLRRQGIDSEAPEDTI